MKMYRDVYTQEELEKTIADSFVPICRGNGEFLATDSAQVTATGSAQVRAYDSAQVTATDNAQVRAYDSAQVTATDNAQVRAYGNAQVTAYGNAQVTAYNSAQVTAYGSAQVTAYDNAQVRATPYVAVTLSAAFCGTATGGVQIKIPPVKTVEKWCEFYGVPVSDGVAILYKGVDAEYKTSRQFAYVPGTQPQAPDWDGGREECGGGLHFSPSPAHTLKFEPDAKHFIACPVAVNTISVHYPAKYPAKVKAPGLCAPCYEVDIDGNPVREETR